MSKILLLGSTGYVGSAFATELQRRSTPQLETMLAQLLAAERACKRTGDQTLTCLHALSQTARM